MPAPIVIFAFNRPEALKNLIDSLSKNPEYEKSTKYVFVDGSRNAQDIPKVKQVIALAKEITTNVFVSNSNKGLAKSIIEGISRVLQIHDRVIVLEDDLICMPGFLHYMNGGLDFFANDSRIISICGYGLKIQRPENYIANVYFSNRSSSWGWATWRNRWQRVDWEIKDWQVLSRNRKMQRDFNRAGSDMYGMLRDYMRGRNQSWAIRFCYNQHRRGMFSVHPFCSLVTNEGFGSSATNCRQKFSRFKTELDMSNTPPHHYVNKHKFEHCLEPNADILRQLRRYHSIPIRFYSLIRKILNI